MQSEYIVNILKVMTLRVVNVLSEFLKAANMQLCGREIFFMNCAKFGFLNQIFFKGFFALLLAQNFSTKILGAQNYLFLESLCYIVFFF